MVFTVFFLLTGCVSDQVRINRALDLAKNANLESQIIPGNLPIQIFYQNHKSKHAAIYLEGDGLVINKYGEAALNSTPTDPMALRLAVVDQRKISKIVINRPYHYIKDVNANQKYWTTARYSPEVIEAITNAIKTCQKQFGFETIEIVAYSGGAAVALLLTPSLPNITKITTFAGNLDHVSWTRYHETQPLYESLDPLKNKAVISKIPQVHFVGKSDDNTTVDLALGYQQKISSNNIKIMPIAGFSHDSNWPEIWQQQLTSTSSQ